MVIDFLVASSPSTRQWSSISYIKALSFGMVIGSQHCIETLSMGLVIDSFTSRPSAKQCSLISWLHWDPLQGNGHQFLTSRPSPLEWSLILNIASRPSTWDWSSIPLHQGPLQSNGHWFLGCIETLCKAMVIDFFTSRPSPLEWSLILFVVSRPSPWEWSSIPRPPP